MPHGIVRILYKLHHGDAGASEAHILIAESPHAVHGGKILTYVLAQRTGACAVQNAHTLRIELQGIVHEIGDGLHRLVGTHAAHVHLGTEMQLALAYLVARGRAHERRGFRPRRSLA